VNNGIDVTFETISSIYSLGFDFELYPFYPGVEPIDEIKVAITTNEVHLIPDTVETIYNIGHMVYDVDTILDLLNELDLEASEREAVIQKYQKTIVTVDRGVSSLIDDNVYVQQEKNTIVNLINEGVIETDNDGNVIMVNEASKKILSNAALMGRSIDEIIPHISRSLGDTRYVSDQLVKYHNEKLIVSTKPIYVFNQKVGDMIILRNVTEIKRLEDMVRKDISLFGHVAKYTIDEIIGESPLIRRVKKLTRKMATAQSTILITGESGTGKELFAAAIHNASDRAKFPYLAINCAALPENLVESELFGYETGAFTGAKKEGKIGLFEQAHHGTLFFDEIAELSLGMQSRLLRVLQESEIIRIGSTRIRRVDVRIIAATNRDLNALAREGRFRWDLYYRLNVFPLTVPPLRDRKEDIPVLFHHFLKEFKSVKAIEEGLFEIFTAYSWPGNVRELRNIAEYLAFMSEEKIAVEGLPYTFRRAISQKEETYHVGEEKHGILRILKEKLESREKVGRLSLMKALEDRGIFLTEREVRGLLEELKAAGYIAVGIGKQGTKITPEGLKVLSLQS
jgi:transcriptional regulator with PAS, ATPase and Fis domain